MSSSTTTTATLKDGVLYAAFYVENLRTGDMSQMGFVEAAQARYMLDNSAAPERLRFAACPHTVGSEVK